MYHIQYSSQAEKFIRKQTKGLQALIKKRMELVAVNPYAPNTNLDKLKEVKNGYRLRIGNIRVVYEIYSDKLTIIAWKINFRGQIYKR